MQVRVMNLNVHPYREAVADKMYEFPAEGVVLMDEDDANRLLSTFNPPKKDAQGRPDPIFFKKLKIHPEDLKKLRDNANSPNLVCHANGQKAASAEELAKVLGTFTHMLAEKDEGAEAEALKKQNAALKKDNKELKSRLDLIEEKLGLRTEANAESL